MADAGRTARSASAALAEFSAGTLGRYIPETVSALMRQCLLDFLGNTAFAAVHADSTEAVRRGLLEFAGDAQGKITVVGETKTRPAGLAVLLNGTYAHSMDFDDTNFFGKLHPGVTVIPAALAVAEETHATGRALMEAIAIGYEIACRVGGSLGEATYARGFHPTPIGGLFGAVAAASRLLTLDGKTIDAAFGLAGSRASGSMQYMENGAWNKRLHSGFAAHDALMVTRLAKAGVTGAAQALEGRAGVLQGYSPEPDATKLTAKLGTYWAAAKTAIKPFPNCRLNHSAIEAAIEMRKRLAPVQQGRYEVRLDPTSYRLVGEDVPAKRAPQNIVDGQFSVYFQVAAALSTGRSDWGSYALLGDAEVEKLARRISAVCDDGLKAGHTILSGRLGDRSETIEIAEPMGEPGRPLGWDGVLAKFMGLAGPALGVDQATALAESVADIAEADDVAQVMALARRSA
ncbi:MmgE/PrpD family protein [Mesorhizobium sp. 1B3]|uniref:MmgE/PrpD family protein n=1 Tax=Mesorhizobium sp. 1B3 TaxID=3243599 RepID=UPI003D989675